MPDREDVKQIEEEGFSRITAPYKDGFCDNLIPLHQLDLSKVNTVSDLVAGMKTTALTARKIGEAADILYEMVSDPDCMVVGTFSGIMTMAQMGLLICEMIDRGMLQIVISTGALIGHGFIQSAGMAHFKATEKFTDKELYYRGYNRVYDTLELEKNMDVAEEIVAGVFDDFKSESPLSSWEINKMLGKYLSEHEEGRGILKSAFLKKVPVFIPAFTDCELALDFALINRHKVKHGKKPLDFNPFIDLEKYTDMVFKSKRVGIFTIGGGVPRNWAQQVGPYLDLIRWRHRDKESSDKYFVEEASKKTDPYFKRFRYAVRICPEPAYWGGLSGCTYSEGVSWGKIMPASEGGKHVEVLSEATIAWPLILKAVMERLDKEGKVIKKNFQHEY